MKLKRTTLLLLIILVIAIGIGVLISRIPEVNRQIAADPSFFDITEPRDGAIVPLGETIKVKGSGILSFVNDQVELYVDGARSADDGDSGRLTRPCAPISGKFCQAIAGRNWIAETPGVHAFSICLYRSGQPRQTVCSDPVHVDVVDLNTLKVPGAAYTAQAEDTLQSVAGKFDLPPLLIVAANPGRSADEPLGQGAMVNIPSLELPDAGGLESQPPAPPPGGTVPPSPPPGRIQYWLVDLFRHLLPNLPSRAGETTLSAKVDGCNVHLVIQDTNSSESGFIIFRQSEALPGYQKIATIGPVSEKSPAEYVDSALFGNFIYRVEMFSPTGTSSSFISVPVRDPKCIDSARTVWKLKKVVLTTDQPVDRLYCYYSFNQSSWDRLPADQNSFFYPAGNSYDLSDQIRSVVVPPLSTLALECWGWRGSDLLPLGAGKTGVKPQPEKSMNLNAEHFSVNADFVEVITIPTVGVIMTPTPKPYIKEPFDLTSTSIIDICIKHFPEGFYRDFVAPLLCKAAVDTKGIILVWEWTPPLFIIDDPTIETVTKIDGYYVYKMYPGGKPFLIKTINDPGQKVLIQPAEPPGGLPPTYFVRAFRLPDVSGDSEHYTLTGIMAGTLEVTIPATPRSENEVSYHTRMENSSKSEKCDKKWYEKIYDYFAEEPARIFFPWITKADAAGSGGGPSTMGLEGIGASEIAVGFSHFQDMGCYNYDDSYYRGSVMFNLATVKGPVSKALLVFTQGPSGLDGVGSFQSCAKDLNMATGISGADVTSYDFFDTLSDAGFEGIGISVDVSDALRDWVSAGETNPVFLLTGRDETFPEENKTCLTRYKDFSLKVTYYLTSK